MKVISTNPPSDIREVSRSFCNEILSLLIQNISKISPTQSAEFLCFIPAHTHPIIGKEVACTMLTNLSTINPTIWTEACAQIFFSIGVCMGVMTSYASYNPVDKPIIGDAFKVAFGNSLFSFFAGFAVFSVAGYLKFLNSPVTLHQVPKPTSDTPPTPQSHQ